MSGITTWEDAREAFEELLDDVYGDVILGGLPYSHGRVLREVDPIAYRCGLLDWLDGEGIDGDDLEGD